MAREAVWRAKQLSSEHPSAKVRAITTCLCATSQWGIATTLQGDDASPLVACGCLGFVGVVIVAFIALNIALLIWVVRDAKNRAMDNAVAWMMVVMLTGIIGLIIFYSAGRKLI